jgi:CPA2 family monovalent cation:H+ antiporter-2
MNTLPLLIKDLGFILITAAFVTLLFKRLKQPLVLGYLIAGFVLGPYFPFFITVKDTHSIHIWAEMGVIFLLFGLGLEFSFKKLSRVGKSASITALFEAAFMVGIGFTTGKLIGWKNIDSLYLGGILSISSTTIIVRAFEELGLKGKKFVNFVFGILIVEDLIAILLLVLLTTVAVTNTLSGEALTSATLKLAFFLTIWFLVGIYVIPLVLSKIKKLLNNETTIVISLGLCLFMVIIATQVGFSAPLGAFIMGSILAETKERKNIEHLLDPIKNLFSAVFFVSVGMMIDPHSLLENWQAVLIITIVTLFGKIFSTTVGALLSGQSLRNSIYTGMSLAQIGEFSFIIASLGLSLKVTSPFLYPIAVAVCAITTFTTPYTIKLSEPFYLFIEKRLPQRLKEQLNYYEASFAPKDHESIFQLIWRSYGIKITLNATVVIAISLATELIFSKFIYALAPNVTVFPYIGPLVALSISSPFLWAVLFGSPANISILDSSNAVRIKNLLFLITASRIFIGISLVVFVISRFVSFNVVYLSLFFILVVFALMLRNFIEPFYHSIEERFMANLNAKEREEMEKQKAKPILAPWDAAMSEFKVSPHSPIVGKTLQESHLKEKCGVTVALIERGHKKIMAPGRTTLIMPYDLFYLIGTDSQLNEAKLIIEAKDAELEIEEQSNYGLECVLLDKSSPYVNKTIRDCGIRENVEGLIVGVEREGVRTLNPDSAMVLRPNDLVWVVADTKLINQKMRS